MLQLIVLAVTASSASLLPDAPVASNFDLGTAGRAAPAADRKRTELASQDPQMPDSLRTADVEAPEVEWAVADNGPVFVAGAFGGRRSGMPKLAHVGLDWVF